MLVLIANLTSLNYETVVVGKDPDDMEHKLDMHLLFSHNLNIGYTMKPRGLRDLEPRGNRYRHPRAKRKGVYRFPRGSKSRRPRGFHRIRYLYYSQSNHFSR